MHETYLDEKEKAAVIAFNSNPVMKRAIRKVLEETIHHQGVTKPGDTNTNKNWVFALVSAMEDNAKLGEMVRASAAGLGYLSKGFENIEEIRTPEEKKPSKNDAI